jgi:hypothetical protein
MTPFFLEFWQGGDIIHYLGLRIRNPRGILALPPPAKGSSNNGNPFF